MRAARADNDFVVVSLFVNPPQFGADRGPRRLPARPRRRRRGRGGAKASTCCSCPTVAEMYPAAPRTTVHVDGLTAGLCGASRPDALRRRHHGGRQAVRDRRPVPGLLRPQGRAAARGDPAHGHRPRPAGRVVGCPLVREPDGLAMSSRNAYLSPDDRRPRTCCPRALRAAAEAARRRRARRGDVRGAASPTPSRTEPLVRLDYAEVVDAATLAADRRRSTATR